MWLLVDIVGQLLKFVFRQAQEIIVEGIERRARLEQNQVRAVLPDGVGQRALTSQRVRD